MPCVKKDGCTCKNGMETIFCEHLNSEHAYCESNRQSIARWKTIPEEVRVRCSDHLRMVVGDHPAVLERWRDQKRRGVAPGSDDVRFHFSAGMAVRNILRQVLTDDLLPGPPEYRNWDDFYFGAIDEVAGDAPAPAAGPLSALNRAWRYWLGRAA